MFWCVLSRTGALDFMQPGARQGAVEFERIARFPADIGLTYGRNVQEHVAGSQRAASRRLDGLVQQNMTFDSPHDTLVSSEQMNNVLRFDAEEVDNSKKQRWRERLLGYDGGDPPSDHSSSDSDDDHDMTSRERRKIRREKKKQKLRSQLFRNGDRIDYEARQQFAARLLDLDLFFGDDRSRLSSKKMIEAARDGRLANLGLLASLTGLHLHSMQLDPLVKLNREIIEEVALLRHVLKLYARAGHMSEIEINRSVAHIVRMKNARPQLTYSEILNSRSAMAPLDERIQMFRDQDEENKRDPSPEPSKIAAKKPAFKKKRTFASRKTNATWRVKPRVDPVPSGRRSSRDKPRGDDRPNERPSISSVSRPYGAVRSTREAAGFCKFFNIARSCKKNEGECKWRHQCSNCHKNGHGASSCKNLPYHPY